MLELVLEHRVIMLQRRKFISRSVLINRIFLQITLTVD